MARSVVTRPSPRFKEKPNRFLPNLGALVVTILLPSCVYGPVALNLRVCNVSPTNLRVETVTDESRNKVQVVIPGGVALDHATVATVHGPGFTTRVAANPSDVSDRGGYKYKHFERRGIGHNDVIFEVMIDGEGKAWAHTKDGARVPFPARVVLDAAQGAASGLEEEE